MRMECQKKIVFSGDVGNLNQPIIKDPQCVKEADYVVIESTYGDRTTRREDSGLCRRIYPYFERDI